MSKLLKLRRGTTVQHSTFTGASGEVTVDTDKKVVVVHDGVTAGGNPVLSAAAGAVASTNLASNAVTTAKIADANVTTLKIADGNVTGPKLENSGVTAGSYGSSSAIPAITVDAKGRITGISTNAVTGGVTTVDGVSGAVTLSSLSAFTKSLAGSGYQKLPGGLIIQWGVYNATMVHGSSYTATFPIAFSTLYQVVAVTGQTGSTSTQAITIQQQTYTTSTFTFQYGSQSGATNNTNVHFIAIGT